MKKHVLVIDDDKGISEVIQIILEDNGYRVTVLSEGTDILKKVKKITPDLILLDIWMAGVDGRDVVKLLKKEDVTKDLPVIVISALSNPEKIAAEAGASDFLPKPFDMDDLLAIVKKHVE